jgi:hypothetical protein
MSIQMSDLTVNDPLAKEEVAIVMRVLTDNAHRPARTVLVSVGTSGQLPTFASGTLEEVADLIQQAWLAYGVQVEVRQHRAEDSAVAEAETVAEATVDGDDGEDETPPAGPVQPQRQAQPARPQPRPQNLSLF